MKQLFLTLACLLTVLIGNAVPVTDKIKADDLVATNTEYKSFSVEGTASGAVYCGESAKSNSGAIQLRSKNENSGIVTKQSGGLVQKVDITVATGKNTIEVYGKNEPYAAASDLFDTTKQGQLLKSITSSGTINITGDYKYIGIRSHSGAVYISSIDITWETETGGDTPTPITVADPEFSVTGDKVGPGATVDIYCSTSDSQLEVSANGIPIDGVNSNPYTYTFPAEGSVTLTAKAYITDQSGTTTYSNEVSKTYTISTTPTPPVGGTVKWVETDIANLVPEDVVIIVDKSSKTALNPNGSSSAPTATPVTLSQDTPSEIIAGAEENMWFQIEMTGSEYSFTHVSTSPDKLYTTGDNNGVRVGTTNSNTSFTWTDGYLKNTGTKRYLGVFDNQDWRSYTSHTGNSNIVNTKTAFYKKVVEQPTCELPQFSLPAGEYEPGTEVTVSCPTAGATIALLTINGADETAAEGQTSYTFRIYSNTNVDVMYIYGDAMSDVATATFTLTKVKGGEFKLRPLSVFNTGDQMVLVNQANLYSMSSLPTTGSAKTNTVTLSEDKNYITSPLTNAEVFTVEKNADGTISLRSNVLNGDSPLYLQYVGSGAEISIAPLANAEGDMHKFDVKVEQLAGGDKNVEQLCVHSNNGRFIRYNGSEAWDAHTGVATDTYTSFYRKPAPVEAPAAAVFTPAPGAVLPGTEVSVTCPTPGAKLDIMVIGTTTDIMDTDVDLSTLPNNAYIFTVTENVDVVATTWVYDNDGTTKLSTDAEASYSLKLPDAPVADSKGGVITEATTVTLTTDQEGATINWKLDNGTGVTSGSGPSPVQVLVDGTATLTYWTSIKVGEQEYKSEEKTLSFILQEPSTWRLADHLIPGKRFFLVGVNTTSTPHVYFATHGHNTQHQNNIGAVDASATTFMPDDNGGIVGNNIPKHITVYDATLPYLMLEETETSGQYMLRYCNPSTPEQVQYLTNASSSSENNRLWVTDGTEANHPVHPVTVAFDKAVGSVRIQFVGGSSHNSIAFHFGSANGNLFSSYTSTTPAHFEGMASETEDIFWPFLYVDAEWIEAPTITPVSGTSIDQPTEVTITPNVENPNSTIYYQINDGEVLQGQPGAVVNFTISGDTDVNYWAEETTTDSEGNMKALVSEHLTATYVLTKTYYRSHKIREGVDYVFVGHVNASGVNYLMTQYNSEKQVFGALQACDNFSLTDDQLEASVGTHDATVVNFRQSGDKWNMIVKSTGMCIASGASGKVELCDATATEDPVSQVLKHDADHYQTNFVYAGTDNAQTFGFYPNSENSKFCSYTTASNAQPIYLYASEKDPVAKENIKFSDDAETMTSTTETIVTGYDWTTGDPKTITGTTSQVDNGYIYVYYDLAATAEQAKNSEANPGVLKYGSDTYSTPAAANYANDTQTAPVKLRVEVELLGNKDGDFSTYKMPNPEVPGGWDDQTYLKYFGLNQTRIHDADAPYVKVPITSQYSVVRATAVGDGLTHIGTTEADVHTYYSPTGSTTGVEGVEAGSDSDAEVKYYNLQGVRISNPSNGVYIRVEGNRVSKVRVF